MKFGKVIKGIGIFFIVVFTLAFNKLDNTSSKELDTTLQSLEFNTDGLYFAEFYDYIFRGHFENIKMTREDLDFLMIFEQYLRTYGRQCNQYLPKDKVEIMELQCDEYLVEKNLYGDELSRTCTKWIWVGTKLFARPDLYNAKKEVERLQSKDAIQNAFAAMTDPNAIGNSMDRVHKINGLRNDMTQMFTLNPCNSEGVRRFEENLKRFALSQKSMRMEGSSKYETMKTTGGPTGVQNLNKLFDDLVANLAKTWAMNKYVPNSISGISMLQKDNQGRPLVAKANYTYQFFGNKGEGWVQVSFEKGLPNCLYFHDMPNNCKTPNSSIVASYAQGNYSN